MMSEALHHVLLTVRLQRIWMRAERRRRRVLQSPLLAPTRPPAPPSNLRKVSPCCPAVGCPSGSGVHQEQWAWGCCPMWGGGEQLGVRSWDQARKRVCVWTPPSSLALALSSVT